MFYYVVFFYKYALLVVTDYRIHSNGLVIDGWIWNALIIKPIYVLLSFSFDAKVMFLFES